MNQLTVSHSVDDPYNRTISQFIIESFPAITKKTNAQVVDALTDAILASNQIRYGPKPPVESQVAIREVIRAYVSVEKPIAVMSPWGSEKPNGTGIDVAELGALKTLICLNDRVKQFHAPGIEVNLRVEDLSAPHQFYDRMDAARAEAKLYTDGLVALARVLGVADWLNVTPDSTLAPECRFNKLADSLVPIMERHIANIFDSGPIAELQALGWDKPLAPETVAHYMDGYAKLYPGRDLKTKEHILARYFAGSLARRTMGLTGALKHWGAFIELYFGKTPPGLDPSRYARRIHYRTLPSSYTSNHIAPWRGKGYLAIDNNSDHVTPKLASFQEAHDYNLRTVTLRNGDTCVDVQMDYVFDYGFKRENYTGVR